MTVRKILSARTARPQVEEMLGALVHAAVFIGGADGRFGEEELEVFIDSMREVVSAAVGEEFLDTMASTARLLDQARIARRDFLAKGEKRFLAELTPRFVGKFSRDGLVLAYRIVLADGKVTDKEAKAFEALAQSLGVDVSEIAVLKELASQHESASQRGHRGETVEAVLQLAERGWTKLPPSDFDAGVSFTQSSGGTLSLELDSGESVLHVHVLSKDGKGPHLVCFFADALPGLLAVLDSLRDTFVPSTLGEKLPAVKAVCPELFVEHEGKFAKL
jgi:tellurite resistance protein